LSFLRLLLSTLETSDSKIVGVGGVAVDVKYELNYRAGSTPSKLSGFRTEKLMTMASM